MERTPVVPPEPVAPAPVPADIPASPVAAAVPASPEVRHKEKPRRDIELNIGKYWLNKIGIGVFVLGVGFLIAYSSRYFGHFGPWGKILTGYLVSAALFFTGWKLRRKEMMANYGHVLTGGAWALAYFTTFAMHHFPQSRVLDSQGADLVLLGAVAAGMLVHSLKYRSEALSGVAIFVGYATATIGDVRFFTLLSCAIESLVILVLVYRFKWLRMLFMGILMTYGAHFLWVMRNMHGIPDADPLFTARSFFLLNATFLTLYWAVFTAGVHLLRKPDDEALEGSLSAANIGNALFYFLLLYPDVTRLFPGQRFSFLLALGSAFLLLGAYLYGSGKGKLFVCDVLLGIGLLTAAVPVKYLPLDTALIWIAELPLLYYAGLRLKSGSIRLAAFLLSAWIILHHFYFLPGSSGMVQLLGAGAIPVRAFTAFAAALSFAGVYTMLKQAVGRGEIGSGERKTGLAFPAAAAAFLSIGTSLSSSPQNLTLWIFLDALALFGWGYFADEPSVRVYSLLFLGWGSARFQGVDDYLRLGALRRWSYIAWEIVCSYVIYFLYRGLRTRRLLGEIESLLVTGVAVSSGLLVMAAVFRYVPENLITFALAGLSAVTFGIGYLSDSRSLRASALAGSALAAVRFVFIDSFPSATPADWAVIVFPSLCMAGIYFLYRKLRADGKLPAAEKTFPDIEYLLFQGALMAAVLRYVPDGRITPALALLNLVLFAGGCLLREKFARCASLLVLPPVLYRFAFLDNYAPGARLWPVTAVLGADYLLVWLYKKAGAAGLLDEDERPVTHLAFAAAAFLTAVALWRYAPAAWAGSFLALAGLGTFLFGYFQDSRDMRVSGSALLGVALFRAVLWDDYSGMGNLMRWLPPAIQALSYGAVYGLYRELRLGAKLSAAEARLPQAVFAGFAVITAVSVLRYCPQFWASAALAALAAAMFFAGIALKEEFVRVCSCFVFGGVAARAFIAAEPYEALGRLRWLPIGAQLAPLLAVYLPYRRLTKNMSADDPEKPAPLAIYILLLSLMVFFVVTYGAAPARPIVLTAAYLAFFALGVLSGDIPLRAGWLALVPAAAFTYFILPQSAHGTFYRLTYAAAVCGGMYAVYTYYIGHIEAGISGVEKRYLPALCLLAGLVALLSVERCVPEVYRTAAASAALAALYLGGTAFRDEVLALSAGLFMPYIFVRRLGNEEYAALGGLLKWTAVLSAPAAFFSAHLAGVKYPGRIFRGAPRRLLSYAGMLPGTLLLLHGIFFYSSASMITLSLGMAGLAFFAPGFYFKDQPLRYAGLLMFAVSVLHIGVVDIAGLAIIYKIISFILMGLILLGVSYIYTRFMTEEPPQPERRS
ncbi:MAG: DUF2339 domain-containing protein [Elusimicrobia bacterium]|nr:DUF2339 domain-containing protein [Elusimicrobiota bacterium]